AVRGIIEAWTQRFPGIEVDDFICSSVLGNRNEGCSAPADPPCRVLTFLHRSLPIERAHRDVARLGGCQHVTIAQPAHRQRLEGAGHGIADASAGAQVSDLQSSIVTRDDRDNVAVSHDPHGEAGDASLRIRNLPRTYVASARAPNGDVRASTHGDDPRTLYTAQGERADLGVKGLHRLEVRAP